MQKWIFAIIIISIASIAVDAQSLAFNGGGAWNTSSGGIISSTTGIQSIYNNLSGLSESKNKWGVDAGVERRYNLDELSTVSLGGYYKVDNSIFALSLVRFGYEDYSEQKINFGYSRKLLSMFSLGGNFSLLQYRLSEFGNKNLLSFDIGLKADITKTFAIATFINNPASLTFDENVDIPVRLAIGTNYHPSPKVEWLAEIEKIVDRDITIKSAIAYYPIPSVSIRVGADLNRNFIGLGVGYNLSGFKLTGAYSINQILGNNPALSLSYEGRRG